MPEAAKAHTKAGAKAFVTYFWQVVDYAQQTGDTDAIAALSLDGCKGCDGGIKKIDSIYSAGGVIHGGSTIVSSAKIEWLRAGGLQLAHVTVNLKFASQTIDMPGSANDEQSHGSSARDRLELVAQDDGWKVSQLVVLP